MKLINRQVTSSEHLSIMFEQLDDKTFKNTTLEFKKEMLSVAVNFVTDLNWAETDKVGAPYTKKSLDLMVKIDSYKRKYSIKIEQNPYR